MHWGIGLQSKIRYALVPLVCLPLLFALTACDSNVGEINDFIAPAEPQIRPPNSKNLVVPILSTLDRSVEEPSTVFSQAVDVAPADLEPIISDYRIGKNDVVSITIFDLMGEGTGEVPKVVRVSETGMVSLPFIGPVKAEGLTEHELEDAVAKAYEDANLIKRARVTATVAEARARTFTVTGNVGAVGEYELTRPDYRMLDAMVAAHGPATTIGVDYVYVIRKLSADKPPEPEAPEPETPAPATQPTTPPGDLLAPPPGPQSQLDPSSHPRQVVLMDQSTSSSNKDLLAPGSDEGASGVIEGKPAPNPNNPTPAPNPQDQQQQQQQDQQAAPPAPIPPEQQPAAPGAPEEPGQFEFNGPKEPTDVRVIRVPIYRLQHYGELKYNIVVRPGDMIVVPDPITGLYYMGGHLLRSGVYSLTGTPVTIKEAWIAAGGGDDLAIPRRSEIIRQLGNDKEVFVRIDLTKVLSGEMPDIYLKPNDIVYVGTNIGDSVYRGRSKLVPHRLRIRIPV